MLSRKELEGFFALGTSQPPYLNFKIREEISNSKPIQNREIATRKSLEIDVLDKIAGLEGSPSFEIITSLAKTLKDSHLIPELSGIGVEVGSGLGLLSAAFIRLDQNMRILGILAVEAGLPFVETGIRLAAQSTLGDQEFKIVPCYGSFDAIYVESETVDFIIQIEALHHADSLLPPIIEAHRILKKGGFVITIDRSWPDEVKREVLEELLDHQYSKEWLDAKGFPSVEPFSRRNNGEHEYRDKDWNMVFEKAGFSRKRICHLHPEFHLWHFVKRIVGLLRMNKLAKIKIPSRSGIFRGFLMHLLNLKSLRIGGVVRTAHPRPLTVSVWQKN